MLHVISFNVTSHHIISQHITSHHSTPPLTTPHPSYPYPRLLLLSSGRNGLLTHIADHVPLVATATSPLFQHKNIQWKGHQTSLGWLNILLESKFLIGKE